MPHFRTDKGQSITTGPQLGRGGEGTVFDVVGQPTIVAKIYHAHRLNAALEAKVTAMVADPPEDRTRTKYNHVSIAWPEAVLYNGNTFIGYIMPKIPKSDDLYDLLQPQQRVQQHPTLSHRHLYRSARNLALAMAAIHSKGYVIGDVNYKNALFNNQALITIVDCDSMQVTDAQNIVHRCLVSIPEYTSPELQGQDFAKVNRTTNHDAFGLAVLTFQLLMQGFHPFAGRPLPGAPDVEQVHVYCLSQQIFPYVTNTLFEPPKVAPPIGALPAILQNLFSRAFLTTTRPTPKEWANALEMVESRLVQCSNNSDHWYPNDGVCVICEVDYNVGRRKRPANEPIQPTVQIQTPLNISTPITPTQPVTNQSVLSVPSSNPNMSTCIIHWFRRDLRLADNPALTMASNHSQHRVIALFVVDDQLVNSPRVGPNRLAFLADRLRTLHAELTQQGSSLLIAYGDPAEVILQLCKKHGAAGVTWQADTAPWARRRDQRVASTLQNNGVTPYIHDSQTIVPVTQVLTDKGTPYTVFTPYYRNWSRQLRISAALPVPQLLPVADIPSQPVWPNWPTTTVPLPDSRAATAQQLLATFTSQRINDYDQGRNVLAQTGTSALSPYLRFGIISAQECARAAIAAQRLAPPSAARSGAEVWLSELAWRDFYQQILYHFPHVANYAFRPMYDDITWDNNPTYFAAWCAGRTGYPIVDAAMRQLNSTGWMHNRARMIVASFLTKDLLIDWRWGERYFMQQLIDGDTAANNGGWQWSAGTGTDAQPYFRIFNPTSQGETFDPDGAYVKRYVPELATVPTKYIHAPWLMPPMLMREVRCLIGHDYPAPIVDHATQRAKALAMYKLVRPE